MRVSVIGCGYLGAVHAAAMAELGHDVIGIDVDDAKIAALTRGEAPFHEPGLEELLRTHVSTGRLRFSTEMTDAGGCGIHFIAVGTPQVQGGTAADLSYVDAAIAALVPHTREGDVIAGKSTVPVGTAERLAEAIEDMGTGAVLAWNPEFLREGWAVKDSLTPDRLVFGLPPDPDGAALVDDVLREVYAPVLALGTPLVVTDFATAELVKVAANAFLATKISFINAMAEIAEVTGADVVQLADAIGHDDRIGRRFLGAGVGFGGGCLPKDIRAFTARAEELGRADSVAFLKEVDAINLRRRQRAVDVVVEELGGIVFRKKVAVLGRACKPA
ncbi:MAG: nucleotide sugar dehydrogenase, partial [Microbacteriaceae bacterium]